MSATWTAVCVLHAARGREVRLESGHCCAVCAQRLRDDLSAVLSLAASAAGHLVPPSGSGGSTGGYESRPPLRVECLDPERTIVWLNPADPSCGVTVLECLEDLEREIRADRDGSAYGPASLLRAQQGVATLTGVVGFLLKQVEWMTTTPDFGLEEAEHRIHTCARALSRFRLASEDPGTMVKCPTLFDDGTECGYRLAYRDWDEHVTCRRCKATRGVAMLVSVAMSDGRDVWLDPEAAVKWLGCSESTLQRMARRGEVKRSHGRYLIRHEEATA